jgi:hypothetical protein
MASRTASIREDSEIPVKSPRTQDKLQGCQRRLLEASETLPHVNHIRLAAMRILGSRDVGDLLLSASLCLV